MVRSVQKPTLPALPLKRGTVIGIFKLMQLVLEIYSLPRAARRTSFGETQREFKRNAKFKDLPAAAQSSENISAEQVPAPLCVLNPSQRALRHIAKVERLAAV